MTTHHLAQINVARILGPIDSEVMSGFVARLAEINAVADAAPGFVWRLVTEDGDATAIRPYEDDRIIVNMSVWESAEALHGYVYRSAHVDVMRRRREWFARMAESFMALWWVPAGHRPSVAEGVARLDTLRALGPTPAAFTFRERFPAPDAPGQPVADEFQLPGECPAL
jgi:hypothetical protein